MQTQDEEEKLLRSVALQNAQSILLARQRAEQELARTQEALRESSQRLASILESITDGFIVFDKEWRLTYMNSRAEEIFRPLQKPRERIIGKNVWQMFPDLVGTPLEHHYRRALAEQITVEFEIFYPLLDSWLEIRAYPAEDTLSVYFQDISKRKKAEETLRENAERLRATFNQAAVGMAIAGLDGRFLELNDKFSQILGYSREELQKITFTDITHADDLAQTRENVRRLLAGEISDYIHEKRYLRKDDVLVWSLTTVALLKDAAGKPRRFIGVIEDITQRKQAEERLRHSEEELRALANSISQLAWIAQPDGSIFWYNRRWYEYTGTTFEQMQGWGWQALHDPEILPQVLERWKASIRAGEPFEMEFPLRGADGVFRWFLTLANPVRDAAGRVLRWFGTNTDVDQVKQVREALRDETRILELLNQTGTALASQLDLQTLVQTATDAGTQLSGAKFGAFFYNVTNAAGESFTLYTLSGVPRAAFEKFDLPRNTPVFNPTFRGAGVVRSDDITQDPRYGTLSPHHGMPRGDLPVRSYLAVPVISRSGEVIGGLFFGHPEIGVFTERHERIIVGVAGQAAIAIDNARLYETAQKAAAERKQLLESERAARAESERTNDLKDQFLANLSHELRTPLSAILGWAQVLRLRTMDNDVDLRQGLEAIERNARVQTQLIEDLLDMNRITSGKVRLDIQPVEPMTFIEAAIETVRPAANAKGIRLEKLLDPAAGPISGDPSRLQQVIWNLLSNAIKFTPKDGKVQILLERVNSHIEISVADTGIGIKPEFLAHVFERFRQADASTTRSHGGLGLGLSIVKHLVELHGGGVRVKSLGEDQGTSFTVHLPLTVVHRNVTDGERLHPKTSQTMSLDFKASDLSGLKVLVVDDETDARELIKRLLTDCKAEVLTAASAAEALPLVETERPQVLVSDIGMPEVDGYELLKRVRALGKDRGGKIPAIALTAFARSEDRTRALRAGFLIHVSKPVEPSELVASIASVTGRAGETKGE